MGQADRANIEIFEPVELTFFRALIKNIYKGTKINADTYHVAIDLIVTHLEA